MEKLVAAHRLRSDALGGGIRMSRVFFEFDADALLRMVDNLERNMKQSMTGSARGKQYERYREKRDGRLRERWGSQGHHPRLEAKRMEESFGEISSQMKEQFGGRDQNEHIPAGVDHWMEYMEQDGEKTYQSEVFGSERVKHGHVRYLDNETPNNGSGNRSEKILRRSSSSFTTIPSIRRPSTRLTSSGSTKQMEKSQLGPLFSDLRKENNKPFTGISNVENALSSSSIIRSKSYAEGPNDFKLEKLPTPQQRRIRSFRYNELNDKTSMKSDSKKSMLCRSLSSGQSKQLVRRGSGIGPRAGSSIAKKRAVKISQIENKEESGDSGNRQSPSKSKGEGSRLSTEPIASGNVEFKKDVILSADTHGGSVHSSYAMSQLDIILEDAEGSTEDMQRTSNLSQYSLQSGLHDVHTGNSAIRNLTHPLSVTREVNGAGVMKKLESDEKAVHAMDFDSSDKPLKDLAKVFKKLFGRKHKIAERATDDSMSTYKASEGFDGMDDNAEGHIPTSHANIKLRDHQQSGKAPKAPHPFFSFPTLRKNGRVA